MHPLTQGLRAALLLSVVFALPAKAAGLEDARALIQDGRFEEARTALDLPARSGNAEAELMMGVLHAQGLGTPVDLVRAFDWQLRAALKGHPGAQSAIAFAYETGRGLPAPDTLRAVVWYSLSAAGGDPDAGAARDALVETLSSEARARAKAMVRDYEGWLQPAQ